MLCHRSDTRSHIVSSMPLSYVAGTCWSSASSCSGRYEEGYTGLPAKEVFVIVSARQTWVQGTHGSYGKVQIQTMFHN
jgi:hypothetical protein